MLYLYLYYTHFFMFIFYFKFHHLLFVIPAAAILIITHSR